MAVQKDGHVVYTQSWGEANIRSGEKNAPSHLFRIGSVTKQFTAAAILKLEEEGKLSVNDRAARYLSSYPAENLQVDDSHVTIHHLLTHTAGIPELEKTAFFKRNALRKEMTFDEKISAISSQPLVSKPGETFSYSNAGYELLGKIIEVTSQKSYDVYIKENFFLPHNLSQTGFVASASEQQKFSTGYFVYEGQKQTLNNWDEFKDRNVTMAKSSGSAFSTTADLLHWIERLHQPGTVLTSPTLEKLFTPNRRNYAYGWVVEERNGQKIHWHNGALSPLGYTSLLVYLPAKKLGLALLSNIDLSASDENLEIDILDLIANREP